MTLSEIVNIFNVFGTGVHAGNSRLKNKTSRPSLQGGIVVIS
jgi:hypothetical protein